MSFLTSLMNSMPGAVAQGLIWGIMAIGVYFFKFPNNFVFGGVTGTAALVAKLTPISASAFSSAANLILLVVGLVFLGKSFAITTGYASVLL